MKMTSNLKPLEEYDISAKTGFLPSKPPLKRLPNEYFAPWEDMMDNFNALLLAGKLRENVHKMPLLDYKKLSSVEEYRRAFLILCMISHSYVWGKLETVSEVLPANLAIPWNGIADYLGVCPVVCHASVVLWNYRLLDQEGPIELSNLATLATYSGSLDESWFYLITTAIESSGAPCLSQLVDAIENINKGDYDKLKLNLEIICKALENMNDNLKRMSERCDPYVFYWKIRPYLAGWENMAEAGLPFGLIYEGVNTLSSSMPDDVLDESQLLLKQYRRYAGGSAAQSSLIAALDVAFGVDHHKTGEKPSFMKVENDSPADTYTNEINRQDSSQNTSRSNSPPPYARTNKNKFLIAMRKYMPKQHREFLQDLEEAANIRPLILQLVENYKNGDVSPLQKDIIDIYNECLNQLKLFRDKHVQIVTLYIVNQARKGPNVSHGEKVKENTHPQTQPETRPIIHENSKSIKVPQKFPQLGLARTLDANAKVVRGTGGTNIMPFLKQSRDETQEMKVELPDDDFSLREGLERKRSWTDWLLRR